MDNTLTFAEKINQQKFLITGEITPPRGTEIKNMIELAEEIKGLIDAVNINDSPMAKMKMNAVSAGFKINQKTGLEVIPHLTCRDRNLLAVQSELLGAFNLGIDNILALTGDPTEVGDHPQARGVFDLDSIGLIELVSSLNQGRDFRENTLAGKTEFLVGAAVNPGADPLAEEIGRLQAKIEAGADFIQTQPIYDRATLERFLEKTHHLDIPILIGILPLTSGKFARYLAEEVPDINIPAPIVQRMEGQGINTGIEIAREFLENIRSSIEGVHLMSAERSRIFLEILEGIR